MTLFVAAVLIGVVLLLILGIRDKDLPEPEPVSPVQHLEEKKARIYENLRDLNFEFRVGKLSDADYQRTKIELQKELAGTLAEIDRILPGAKTAAPAARKATPAAIVCPHCGAKFEKAMKFCGQCGKPMEAA